MRMFKELSIAALVIGMQTTALCSNNYEDLIAKGYRWVSIDGPYASKLEGDAQLLSKNPTYEEKLQLLRAGNTYYLIEGSIVKVLQTDTKTGMVEIQVPAIAPQLWTSAKFLSKRPIQDASSVIQTPDTIGWTFIDSDSVQSVKKDTSSH